MGTFDYREKVIESLKEIYNEYHSKGLLSIYLWGSFVSGGHDPLRSDIDSVGIVDDSAGFEDQKKIKKRLEELAPDIERFNLNYLSLDELNGGKSVGKLASVIDPKLLLMDFPYWKHVCGKKFNREDFAAKNLSIDEAIKLEIKKFNKYLEEGQRKYYLVKNVVRICWLLNMKKFGKHSFSYDNLRKYSYKKTKNVLDLCFLLKDSGWKENLIKKRFPEIVSFVKSL